jgi:hypothetical protein
VAEIVTLALLMAGQILVAAMLALPIKLSLAAVEAGSARARHWLASTAFYAAALWPLASVLPEQLTITYGPNAQPLFDARAFSFADIAAQSPWRELALACVVIAFAVSLARLGYTFAALVKAERIAANATLASPEQYGLPSQTRIGSSESVNGPMLIGLLRPTIVFPPRLADAPDLPALLRHELAHLQRGDLQAAFMQRVIEDLCWWNWPLLQLGRWLAEQREIACDEYAAADPTYAHALLRETRARAAPPPLAAGISGSPIERRLERLAEPRRQKLALSAALITLVIFAGAIAAPRLDRASVTVIGIASS